MLAPQWFGYHCLVCDNDVQLASYKGVRRLYNMCNLHYVPTTLGVQS
jgi:hypothetical protein